MPNAKVKQANLATDVIDDRSNANKGTARGRKLLGESIGALGAGRSIVVDAQGRIVAGNKSRAALVEAGLTEAIVVETDGKTPVVVKRTDWDLDDPKGAARQYAYYDNRVAELDLDWDKDELRKSLEAGTDLGSLWDDRELAALLGRDSLDEPEPSDGTGAPERAVEHSVWRLGEHVLACGDSTNQEVVAEVLRGRQAQLCFTDPPWNVAIGTGHLGMYKGRKKERPIANDDMSTDEFAAFLERSVGSMNRALVPGAAIYVVMSSQEWPAIDGALRAGGFHWSATIIWVKDRLILSQRDYHTRYEPIWYGWRDGAGRIRPVVDRKQDDVWEIARPARSEEHPTMKPIELCARAIQNSSEKGDLVFEPFGGSGSTLLACEQLGRACAAIELAPRYCDVILQRWQELSGREPERIG